MAFTMFDSGSTADSVSPEFAKVANLKVHPLLAAILLQLGTVGSWSKINFGMQYQVKFHLINIKTYIDIVNIDHYDVIFETVFMRHNRIFLDLLNDTIWVYDKPTPSLSEGEEKTVMARRYALRRLEPQDKD